MGKIFDYILLQREHTNGPLAREKMLDVIATRELRSNHNEATIHTQGWLGWLKPTSQMTTRAGEGVDKQIGRAHV